EGEASLSLSLTISSFGALSLSFCATLAPTRARTGDLPDRLLTKCGSCLAPPPPTCASTVSLTRSCTYSASRAQVTSPFSFLALPRRPSRTWKKKTPCFSLAVSNDFCPDLQLSSDAESSGMLKRRTSRLRVVACAFISLRQASINSSFTPAPQSLIASSTSVTLMSEALLPAEDLLQLDDVVLGVTQCGELAAVVFRHANEQGILLALGLVGPARNEHPDDGPTTAPQHA